MPYVTDDDSKAVKRIAEIEQELQERRTELDEWLAASEPPSNAAAMAYRERAIKALTDQIQALATALDLQRCSGTAPADGRTHVDQSDRQGVVSFLTTSAAAARSARDGHRRNVGG